MGNYSSKQQGKRVRDTDASSPITSKKQRHEQSEQCESDSPLLLPSSDSLEKIDVPLASGSNSDPSASSTSVNGNNYYVFLSFRGPDTRNGFVDHLYHRLKDVGLKFHPNFVFRDDKDLPFGEKIGENLISAIKHSKVSIPVISENYAASEWCICELIQIMECKKTIGQIVLPVFYNVKPYEVRELQGAFGEAFESRKDRFKKEEVKQKGPVALRELVDSRVFESEKTTNGREGELVNELVEIILRELQHDFQPHLPANLVAIEDRVAEVMELVDLACPDTRIIGIWGMGGIGKTTLATIIYKKLFNKFQCRSSLQDIREEINRKGVEHVQSLLISEITKSPPHSVHKSDIGIAMIQLSCENKKVLILLDDVDHQDHLDKLIGGCNFGLGSRIIITCRDKALLKSEYKRYELKVLNLNDSLILFSRCAFEGEQGPTRFTDLSNDIVATTGGLPLALKVIGSLLNGEKDQMVWREMLEKLRNVPAEDVQEKLRISYDKLTNKEKQIFLDIACVFIGTDKRIATYLWADLKFFPITGLQVLINRSLIKINEENQLTMHDQLRDLGRSIARPEDVKPWHWSRPWDVETMKILGRKVMTMCTFRISQCSLVAVPQIIVVLFLYILDHYRHVVSIFLVKATSNFDL
ncbi:hypothetical protein ACJRO7_013554 [Eucalyptus globulus]|uniref:TIR domain-containing protein n=1 Tax=Eucalyptus globulus TaxID=34317 RepID=A0ABD3KYA1_EUCGL